VRAGPTAAIPYAHILTVLPCQSCVPATAHRWFLGATPGRLPVTDASLPTPADHVLQRPPYRSPTPAVTVMPSTNQARFHHIFLHSPVPPSPRHPIWSPQRPRGRAHVWPRARPSSICTAANVGAHGRLNPPCLPDSHAPSVTVKFRRRLQRPSHRRIPQVVGSSCTAPNFMMAPSQFRSPRHAPSPRVPCPFGRVVFTTFP
jgi:hypothetical protein